MDALHVGLGLAAAAGIAGVVWLLVKRGAEAARLSAAEEAARAERERREQVEKALDARGAELQRQGEVLARAEKGLASVEASFTAEREGRERDRMAAKSALDAALESERALWQQRIRERESVFDAQRTALEEEKRKIEASLASFTQMMKESFGQLAGDVLARSNTQFLELARQQFEKHAGDAGADLERRQKAVEELVKPIRETLGRTEAKLSEIEKMRTETHADLKARIEEVTRAGQALKIETGNLVKALREPQVRGRYGEIQLRRVAELAGMRGYCDFAEQDNSLDSDGHPLRPDMVVKLPNGRHVVVDAKANLKPYLDAIEARDSVEAEARLQDFADGLERQAAALSKKAYWKQYDGSPQFVVMFVPAEQFLDAALARRPDLLEKTAGKGVVLVGPGSLIALLRAVHLGFQEQQLSEKAKEMGELVVELHRRLTIALGYAGDLGRSLRQSVDRWNSFVGSVTDRLLPQVKSIEAAGGKSDREPPLFEVVTTPVRKLPMPAGEGDDR